MQKAFMAGLFVILLCSTAAAVEKRFTVPLGDSPQLGPRDAPVTIIEFLDFQWPHCKAAGPTVKKIMDTFKGKVKLVIKNNPYKYRDYSHIAAEASLAAADQGRYWEMHDMLLKNSPQLDRDSLIKYARELGLDLKKFTECIDRMRHSALIEQDKKLAVSLDIYNTPTFYINGRKVVGEVPYDYLKKVVEEEMANAKR